MNGVQTCQLNSALITLYIRMCELYQKFYRHILRRDDRPTMYMRQYKNADALNVILQLLCESYCFMLHL